MSKSSGSSGVGVIGLLGVMFIGLKLTGHIDWSWWWVLSPFWGAFLLWILVVIICIAVVEMRGK